MAGGEGWGGGLQKKKMFISMTVNKKAKNKLSEETDNSY